MSNNTQVTIPNVAEHDLTIWLPNGEAIVIQYRNEGTFPSLDICFEQMRTVYNWGKDMKPAKKYRPGKGKARKGEFEVLQLWIGLDPNGKPRMS